MKSSTLYACIIAMLLFSAAAVAEILPWGDGSTSGSASASASHGNYYDPDSDSGDNGNYTTVAGYFSYHYEAKADIETSLNLYGGGWGGATAIASGNAGPVSAYMYSDLTSSGSYDPPPDEPPCVNGYDYFDAYTGVEASWDVVAVCEIEEGTWSDAFAWANAYASASM